MTFLLALLLTPLGDTSKFPPQKQSQMLYELIMEYRDQKSGLPYIKKNDSLDYVALRHCEDLINYYADTTCNLWSWSAPDANLLTGCPNKSPHGMKIMYYKPWELKRLNQPGFEMIHMHGDKSETCSPTCAFQHFRKDPLFNDMMLEKDDFDEGWKKIWAWIKGPVASVWFTNQSFK